MRWPRSDGFEPEKQIRLTVPWRKRRSPRCISSLLQGSTLHFQVNPSVDFGALDVSVTENVANDDCRVSGLQEVDRLRVSEAVRSDPSRECAARSASSIAVLLHQVSNSP